jgi:hypothetical protein
VGRVGGAASVGPEVGGKSGSLLESRQELIVVVPTVRLPVTHGQLGVVAGCGVGEPCQGVAAGSEVANNGW